jgi:hypothetical protein
MEEDGLGIPPPEVRRAILSRDGVWGLITQQPIGHRAVVGAVARLTGLRLGEAWDLAKGRTAPWALGTEAEARWLAHQIDSRVPGAGVCRTDIVEQGGDLLSAALALLPVR